MDAHAGALCRYPSRTILFRQGQAPQTFYVIGNGLVKLSRSSETGQDLVVGFRTAGWLLGAHSALLDRPFPVTAETVGECDVRPVAAGSLLRLERANPCAMWLARSQAREVHDLIRTVSQLGMMDLRRRLEAVLAWLGTNSALDAHGARRLPPLTHEELASSIGASRERVTKMIHHFHDEGLIQREGGWIAIPQGSRLFASSHTAAAGDVAD